VRPRALLSLIAPFALTLTGCIGTPVEPPRGAMPVSNETPTRRAPSDNLRLPPMKAFARALPMAPARANAEIAQDFLDLTFQLESGRSLPVMTRFEGPIKVAVTGRPSPATIEDLRRLLKRLRAEAGIDIDFGTGPNQITVQSVSSQTIRRYLPQAACFVVPGISRLTQYHSARRQGDTDWARLETRQQVAIFVPNDVSPQETRDCLHEELAPALGPLNDLYRLPASTFNDDNMHAVLTGFDMLILRLTYAPELRSGLARDAVAQALPALLARLNPAGQGQLSRPLSPTPPEWAETLADALNPALSDSPRLRAGRRVMAIAQSQGWEDHRTGFAHYVMARLVQPVDRAAARAHLHRALGYFRDRPETAPHAAHVAAQLAAHALRDGDGDTALALLQGQADVARRAENAALLSSIQMLRAEALTLSGHSQDAAAVRLDSLGWARYGFGPDWAVRAKLDEIAALPPIPRG
jgi:hypothetical protein